MEEKAYLQRYCFNDLGLLPEDVVVLEEMQAFNLSAEAQFATIMQWPEPGMTLDLASRSAHTVRQFKHIHQVCLMHTTHFESSNMIKTTYLIDAYLWATARLNAIAIYSSARSILELYAMLSYVRHRLDAAQEGNYEEWRKRGEQFFKVILQARYGTTNKQFKQLLKAQGLTDAEVQPIKLDKARKLLAGNLPWVEDHYNMLCDNVHHNLASQRTAGALLNSVTDIARSSSGGGIIMPQSGPVVQYQFPMPEPGRRAVNQTAKYALESLKGLVKALNEMPRSPYSEQELLDWTGTKLGMHSTSEIELRQPSVPAIGRNEPCPCGSGKKYKKCHGA